MKVSAYLDLALGTLLVLALMFPEQLFGFVDVRLNFILGFIFILLTVGRGIGLGIIAVFFMVLEGIVRSIDKWYVTALFKYVYNQFMVFLVSYLEGMFLLMVTAIILMPIALPVLSLLKGEQVAGTSLDDLPLLKPLKTMYDQNMERFARFEESIFGTGISKDGQGGTIFVMAILLTASSFFSLYLIKVHNFSIGRFFVGWRGDKNRREQSAKAYEDLLNLVRGREQNQGGG